MNKTIERLEKIRIELEALGQTELHINDIKLAILNNAGGSRGCFDNYTELLLLKKIIIRKNGVIFTLHKNNDQTN